MNTNTTNYSYLLKTPAKVGFMLEGRLLAENSPSGLISSQSAPEITKLGVFARNISQIVQNWISIIIVPPIIRIWNGTRHISQIVKIHLFWSPPNLQDFSDATLLPLSRLSSSARCFFFFSNHRNVNLVNLTNLPCFSFSLQIIKHQHGSDHHRHLNDHHQAETEWMSVVIAIRESTTIDLQSLSHSNEPLCRWCNVMSLLSMHITQTFIFRLRIG